MSWSLASWRHFSHRSAVRCAPILRLLTQDRAAGQHTSAAPHTQNGSKAAETPNEGEEMPRSADVSRLLDGLRERLSALERMQADAVNSYQNADASGSGRQSAADIADPYAPLHEQMLWAQRTPQLVHTATAGLEDLEPAEGHSDGEQEVYDPVQFDASELGDSAEARRLLSILCAPVRLPAPIDGDDMGEDESALAIEPIISSEGVKGGKGLDGSWEAGQHWSASTDAEDERDEAAGPWYASSQDVEIPEAAADYEWQGRQTYGSTVLGSQGSAGDAELEVEMLQAQDLLAEDAGEDVRPEAVPEKDQRLLQAGIVGVPNSGKSTLTNALVGHKVSAVSSKTNTTDATRLGAFTEGPSQVALYDTPGVVSTRFFRGNQHAKRVRSAWGTASDCEMLLFIVDAHRQITEPDDRVVQLVEELAAGPLPSWNPPPALLLLNKIDRLSKEERPMLGQLAEHLNRMYPFQKTFHISAKHRVGIRDLRQYLLSRSTPGKWALQAGESTDMTPNDIAREVLKEKVFRRLYKELPYEVEIEDVSFKTLTDGSLRIEKNLMVRTDQVRRIVVGKQGAAIGEIGASARKDLEAMLQKRVHLMVNVKVMKKSHA